MQRILLIAFMRGIGGGLALAATPYLVSAIATLSQPLWSSAKGMGTVGEDAGDAWRYFKEMRIDRRRKRGTSQIPGQGWQPELDGEIVPE